MRDRAPDIASAIVAWAKRTPADERTKSEYLSTVQFVETLVPLLPPDRASPLLGELKKLRVAVFVVSAVREQMRFDTPRLIVEAGKPFQLTLENNDLMPHNLAIVKPGTRQRMGKATLGMKPDQLDSDGRAYIPSDDAIIAATRLVDPGDRETLKLTAPADEGDYEYVCTYPDHWQVMWGTLVVTKDIDGYLRTHRAPPPATTQVSGHHAHHTPN
jgi:azurin